MKILYFAWLRERLNRDQEDVSPPDSVKTINDVIDWMMARDEDFAFQFKNRAMFRAALDDELVDMDTPIAGASRIAFLPPMTGG